MSLAVGITETTEEQPPLRQIDDAQIEEALPGVRDIWHREMAEADVSAADDAFFVQPVPYFRGPGILLAGLSCESANAVMEADVAAADDLEGTHRELNDRMRGEATATSFGPVGTLVAMDTVEEPVESSRPGFTIVRPTPGGVAVYGFDPEGRTRTWRDSSS